MAEQNPETGPDVDASDESVTPGYKPPAQKTLDAILQQDTEDESLEKYKAALLGNAKPNVAAFPDDPRRVIVTRCALVQDGRDDQEMNLQGDLKELKKRSFVMKEGTSYKVKVYFYVQHDIVTGLRFTQKSYKKGIQVDKTNCMVGSYGPKLEEQSYTTPVEDLPTGMIARGSYTNKSCFTDDDKNEYLKWEWTLDIKKDWAN